jgi:hypothetical protein
MAPRAGTGSTTAARAATGERQLRRRQRPPSRAQRKLTLILPVEMAAAAAPPASLLVMAGAAARLVRRRSRRAALEGRLRPRARPAARAAPASTLVVASAAPAAALTLTVKLRQAASEALDLWPLLMAAQGGTLSPEFMVPEAEEASPTPAVARLPMVLAMRFLRQSRPGVQAGIPPQILIPAEQAATQPRPA